MINTRFSEGQRIIHSYLNADLLVCSVCLHAFVMCVCMHPAITEDTEVLTSFFFLDEVSDLRGEFNFL